MDRRQLALILFGFFMLQNVHGGVLYFSTEPITHEYCESLVSKTSKSDVNYNDLAICLLDEVIVSADLKPEELLKKAINQDSDKSLYNLCLFYIAAENYDAVVGYVEALPNDKYMMEIKSTLLLKGYIEADNKNNPLKLLEESAKLGNSIAQYKLGIAYKNGFIFKGSGEVIEKDVEKAIYWLDKAQKDSIDSAVYELGYIFENELKDHKKAFEFYYEAAGKGDVKGLFAVARAFELGLGVTIDTGRAIYLYEAAAKEGYSDAWTNLGNIFIQGADGVPVNFSKAQGYLERGAESGNPKSQHNLALFYLKGMAGEEGFEIGFEYLKMAADNGYEKSKKLVEILIK